MKTELTAKDKADIIVRLGELRDDRGDRKAQAAADEDYGMASWWETQAQLIQQLMLRVQASI